MSTLFYERTPFDILVRNFFQDASTFSPLAETKVPHPVDIYTTDTDLVFDIAATGISKEDIQIQTQNSTLRVNYDKSKAEENKDYIHKGIARRSFDMGWKVSPKFDLTKIKAKMANGLLKVEVPMSEESKPKTVTIK